MSVQLQFFLCLSIKDAEFLAGIREWLLGTLRWSKTISALGNQLRVEDTKFLVVAAVSPERSHNRQVPHRRTNLATQWHLPWDTAADTHDLIASII
jgi:hypothetical protein